MAYYGKEFTLDSQENFEKFVASFGDRVPDNIKQAISNHKGTLKLVKNGDEYTLSSSQPGGGVKDSTFKSGQSYDDEIQGNKFNSTYVLDGNVLTQEMKFVDGPFFTAKREFFDDKVVATVQASNLDFVVTRIYK